MKRIGVCCQLPRPLGKALKLRPTTHPLHSGKMPYGGHSYHIYIYVDLRYRYILRYRYRYKYRYRYRHRQRDLTIMSTLEFRNLSCAARISQQQDYRSSVVSLVFQVLTVALTCQSLKQPSTITRPHGFQTILSLKNSQLARIPSCTPYHRRAPSCIPTPFSPVVRTPCLRNFMFQIYKRKVSGPMG